MYIENVNRRRKTKCLKTRRKYWRCWSVTR
jgi:hypothetical protein